MLKQANFAIYLILFGSLLSISFFFTKEISKVITKTLLKKTWNENYFYESKCRVQQIIVKPETSPECLKYTKISHCYHMKHFVVYHFKDLFHSGVVDTYLPSEPNLNDYPKEHPELKEDESHHEAEKIPCFFNTKNWQHVMFTDIDIFYFINNKTVGLSLALFVNVALIFYFLNLPATQDIPKKSK
jgi:hypothetical protein